MTERAIPATTLAILFGASEFPRAGLAGSRSFLQSARDFAGCLLDERYFGLPSENLLNLFDSELSADPLDDEIGKFLRMRQELARAAGQPIADLIVYYVGHGDFSANGAEYFLALRNTRRESLDITAYPADVLSRTLTMHAAGIRRYLILDCCFSAAAYRSFQAGPLEVSRQRLLERLPKRGTALLCASGAHVPALAPEGLAHTMFSGALLDVLTEGDAESVDYLSIARVGELVRNRVRRFHGDAAVRPEVHSPEQSDGDVAIVGLFRNVVGRSAGNPGEASLPAPVVPLAAAPVGTFEARDPHSALLATGSLETVEALIAAIAGDSRALSATPEDLRLRNRESELRRNVSLAAATVVAVVLLLSLTFGGVYFGGFIEHERLLWLFLVFVGLAVALALWWRSRFHVAREWRRELASVRAQRASLPETGTREDLAYVGALVDKWRQNNVSFYGGLPAQATEILEREKRRVAGVIADEKRSERHLATAVSAREEWQRRVGLASSAGDLELTREAATRVREQDEEVALLRGQHAHMLRLSNAEKLRLRALYRSTENLKRRIEFLNSELRRAGRTRAAERAAVAFLQAVLAWRFALREPRPEVD